MSEELVPVVCTKCRRVIRHEDKNTAGPCPTGVKEIPPEECHVCVG